MEYISPLPPQVRVRNVRLGAIMTALIVLVAGFGLLSMRGFDWLLLKTSLRNKFADVRWITTEQLAQWIGDSRRPAPLLLDVRTEAEWNVSHLPGAQRVEPGTAALPDAAKDAAIVTYCAVGYRSGDFARRLRAAGFTDVQNLEGSIFQWANEHRPLVRGSEKVARVHPYNDFWARLLAPDVRAPAR